MEYRGESRTSQRMTCFFRTSLDLNVVTAERDMGILLQLLCLREVRKVWKYRKPSIFTTLIMRDDTRSPNAVESTM